MLARLLGMIRAHIAATFAVASALSGCAQYAKVSERPPMFQPVHAAVGALATTEQDIVGALTHGGHAPLEALGKYLDAADVARERLRQSPGDAQAREDYNFAVARIFTTIHRGKLDPWTQPLRVPSKTGDYLLTYQPDPLKRKVANPELYEFTPADEFAVKGTYVTERTVKAGLGAPLVVVGKDVRQDALQQFAPPRTYYGVTAVLRFTGRRAVIELADPLSKETVALDGRSYPLAGDFTVPLAMMLARENPLPLELGRLFQPEKYAETAHIVRLQPYDPNKTVVLVVHGLMDSPATWTPMLNSLRGDAEIREHYQFWYYSYPSGYPYPYSAAILRHELDAIEKRFPLHRKMVVIGHSMGGMITRLLVTDSGDKLWLAFFRRLPPETRISVAAKAKLEDSLIFRHRPEIGRVIFISTPHRGSNLAINWIGRIGSSLIRVPVLLFKVGNEIRKALVADSAAMRLDRIPNSIDTLAPNNRFVLAINTIPITPGIPYDSIIGDRGKGGNKDHTPPVSSDGVVPYWSSHLDGAQSELIVPSDHSGHQNPQAIAEVRRILELHAGRSVDSIGRN